MVAIYTAAYGWDASRYWNFFPDEVTGGSDVDCDWGFMELDEDDGKVIVGVRVPESDKGIVVTQEVEAEAAKAYAAFPADIKAAICGHMKKDELPPPEFMIWCQNI